MIVCILSINAGNVYDVVENDRLNSIYNTCNHINRVNCHFFKRGIHIVALSGSIVCDVMFFIPVMKCISDVRRLTM